MKFRPKKLSLALGRTFSAGMAVTFVSVAYAQTPPSTPPSGTIASPPAIILAPTQVTGSRIPSPNLTSTSPITQVTATDIRIEGVNNVENLLNNLPQVFADQGGNISNGSSGTATVNLRNLGATRTLVLVNGRRLPAGSPSGGSGAYATDINQIPAPLIERVEILTGGASAIYGSDAVAGVVNFIMKENFQGLQLQYDTSGYNHRQHNGVADIVAARAVTNPAQFAVPGNVSYDGKIYDASITMGSNFENNRGNATLFFHYKKDEALLQKERDFSACSLASDANGFSCGGSSTSYPGRFRNLTPGAPSGFYTIADAAGGVRPFSNALDQFNFAPYNYYQRPDERYGFNAFAHYDVNDHARAYGEFSFNDDHTVAQIAPSGIFGVDFLLKNDNPLLSQAFKTRAGITATRDGDVLIGRRNIEGGGRQDDLRHTSFRGVVGVKGDIAKYWDYDVFVQTGKVIYQETYKNDFSLVRIGRALDVTSDANGNPVCRSVVDGSDPNCVPYNIFKLGGVTQGALKYLQTPGFKEGSTQQSVQGATLTSDLGNYGIKTPWAKSGVGVAFGLERRVEKLDLSTDVEFDTGDLAGQGGPTHGLGGKFTVKDAFVEVKVPVIEGAPWADLLSVNGSYRYSDYSTNHTTDSYGLGVEWAPIKAVRLRGSYQQAVRAANVVELFTAQGNALFNLDNGDPCAGPTPSASLAQCQRTGLSAAKYGSDLLTNPAGQYNYLQGGNPDLEPEKAKSTTLGVVLTPMKNLSASIDYFKIKVDKQINNIAPPIILSQCVSAGTFCDLIHRDANGTLWLTGFITATNLNIAQNKTSGVDVAVNYNWPLEKWGSVDINFVGTWLQEFKVTPVPGLGEYDCAGLYGSTCGTPLPEWRHRIRGTWMTPWNLDLSATWRHFDKVKIDTSDSNPLLAGAFTAVNAELGQRDYLDLAASWSVTKQFTIWGGVNNVFDKDPPLSSAVGAGFGNGNTYPQVYDALGRKLFLSLQYRF
jgi:iron complex outermembrane receptor protein